MAGVYRYTQSWVSNSESVNNCLDNIKTKTRERAVHKIDGQHYTDRWQLRDGKQSQGWSHFSRVGLPLTDILTRVACLLYVTYLYTVYMYVSFYYVTACINLSVIITLQDLVKVFSRSLHYYSLWCLSVKS